MRVVGNIQMKVNKIIQETPFVKQFELIPVDGKPLPAFTGGSHLTTFMPAEDMIFEREYSIISHPRDRKNMQFPFVVTRRLAEVPLSGMIM